VLWRRRDDQGDLFLGDVARFLMRIDAKLDEVLDLLREDDDDEEAWPDS
jgi:hypothetical protein